MEIFSFQSLFLCAIIVFLSFNLHCFIHKRGLRKSSKFDLPPGTTGWPLIGETLDFLSKIRNGSAEKFISERRIKYKSNVFKTSLIGQPFVVLHGAEGNKFLFSNENKLVQVWWPASIDKIFPKSHDKSNHEDFISVRKMLSAYLKPDALQRFVNIADLIMKQHLHVNWNCQELKVTVAVKKFTLALACKLFLSIDDPSKVEKLSEDLECISQGMLSMAINIPGTAFNRAVKASKEMRGELQRMIKQRKIEILENRDSSPQDILSQMLLATDDNGQFSNEFDIASYLLGLLHGGYDTINSVLTFIVKYLAEYPDVYDEVFKEQLEISKKKQGKELLDWEDLRKMRYSWNVASEVLRLTPPIFGTFREAIADFTYDGYLIPKGWKLLWMTHDTHKKSEYFDNPKKFDPSRFERNNVGATPYTYVPFGGGPRMCPGNEYTRLVILVFMHNIVTKFKWEKAIPDEKIVYDVHPMPAQGLPVHLYPHTD